MSNRIYITRTQFKDTHTVAKDTSFGCRVNDSYGSAFTILESQIDDDGELIHEMFNQNDDTNDMKGYAIENGVTVDDHHYSGEEVINMLNSVDEKKNLN